MSTTTDREQRMDEQGRAVKDGPQVEIGGNERYVSVSRAEFKRVMAHDGHSETRQSALPLGDEEKAP